MKLKQVAKWVGIAAINTILIAVSWGIISLGIMALIVGLGAGTKLVGRLLSFGWGLL